jgi:uncharacterized protein (TIGR00369 family)
MQLVGEHPDGSVEVAVDPDARHEREGGIVHGGVMMALLDSAMSAAVGRTLEAGGHVVSVSITTDFLKPARRGRLVARAWVDRRGRTTAFPRSELRDAEGNVVARASGVWAIREASPS